jgi:hypothetical protein
MLEINLLHLKVRPAVLMYIKLYTTVENILLCANTTSYGEKCKKIVAIQLYHMFSKPLIYASVLGDTCTHISRMYCTVLCTNVPRNKLCLVYCNRSVYVNRTLTHARLTVYQPPLANGNPPHAECLQTGYVYTQYVQAYVLSQFASPPGGECTYHIRNCSVDFTILHVYWERNLIMNLNYRDFGKLKSSVPGSNMYLIINFPTKIGKETLNGIVRLCGFLSGTKCLASNVSLIPVQISVRYDLSKMSVSGEESQPSLQPSTSAGEYIFPACISSVIYIILSADKYLSSMYVSVPWYYICTCRDYTVPSHSYTCICAISITFFCCDGSKRYGE